MITIDGIEYNADWVFGTFVQTADIINGDGSGRLQGSKKMYLEYVGTFFNHSGQIHKSSGCTDEEWNNLYRVLSNPKNNHTIIFPFDDGTIEQEVYIASISRKPRRISESKNLWETVYEVTLPAVSAAWMVDQQLGGYSPYDNG